MSFDPDHHGKNPRWRKWIVIIAVVVGLGLAAAVTLGVGFST